MGFTKWLFKGVIKSPSTWGLMLIFLSAGASLGGCPPHVHTWIMITGWIVILFDWLRYGLEMARWRYDSEQKELVEKLKQ